MNQILITKKLYITPELKRKKKIYKFDFFISVFLVVILISFAIYAEYDRNKGEAESQEILSNIEIPEDDPTVAKSNILIVVLDDDEQTEEINEANNEEASQAAAAAATRTRQRTQSGYAYTTIATISIPKISLEYPILDGETDTVEETESLLKIAPTKFHGSDPNEVGNFCIVGHNYRNSRFFSKVPSLINGDIITITDLAGRSVKYKVYKKMTVDPSDVSCTSQLTNGQREITLITCTDDSKLRVVVKAREVK